MVISVPAATVAAVPPPVRVDPLAVAVMVALVETEVAMVTLLPMTPGCRALRRIVANPDSAMAFALLSPAPELAALINSVIALATESTVSFATTLYV